MIEAVWITCSVIVWAIGAIFTDGFIRALTEIAMRVGEAFKAVLHGVKTPSVVVPFQIFELGTEMELEVSAKITSFVPHFPKPKEP